MNVRDFYRDAKKFYKPINLNLNFDLEYNFTRNVAVNFKYILWLSNIVNNTADDINFESKNLKPKIMYFLYCWY